MVRITNKFVECGEGDERLKLLMKLSLDEATHQRWDDFFSGPIADMNKKNEINLVSGRRRGGDGQTPKEVKWSLEYSPGLSGIS